jgi:hypothetical protein
MQRNVNAAPTAQEGGRLHALISALVGSGIGGGYLANARSTRPAAPSPSTARSSRSAAGCTRRRRRTASGGAPSTRAGPPRATRWPTGSPPVSRQHAASRDQPAEPDVPLAQGPVLAGEQLQPLGVLLRDPGRGPRGAAGEGRRTAGVPREPGGTRILPKCRPLAS